MKSQEFEWVSAPLEAWQFQSVLESLPGVLKDLLGYLGERNVWMGLQFTHGSLLRSDESRNKMGGPIYQRFP